jgi:hypothetical protein
MPPSSMSTRVLTVRLLVVRSTAPCGTGVLGHDGGALQINLQHDGGAAFVDLRGDLQDRADFLALNSLEGCDGAV